MQGLHDTRLAAEAEYYINYIRKGMERKESLYYKGNNSYSFVTEVNIYHFKAKDSEWLDYPMCLGNISKDFSDDNMK